MDALSTTIFNEWFWLPGNTTWKDFARFEQDQNIKLTNPKDLLYAFPLTGVIYVIRMLFKRYIAEPIGRSLGIRDRVTRKTMSHKKIAITKVSRRGVPIDVNQTAKQQQVDSVDSSSSLSRSHPSSFSQLAKFSESCWRFIFGLSSFIYGIAILQNKPWTWDTRYCWLNYPNQPLSADIFWYYMIVLGFYGTLLSSPFIDAKRKVSVEEILFL
ncbi:unnamed protein product [Rotaria sp. Silwood1]|nr:unnamed protein product [Rotaria sp. Silwood1]CAF4731994.1 unnamed protein product [Rotaria sp. Silwood1]